ncbi:hypothetical protein CEF21_15045 [Bacillus sp. FJAT-42376]|uniref:hypothetical protein n=1 Tax=Bacillus sp. FJAT-42376 TaxID=2014076 RepID=UPI000F4DF9E6|nr:hypothetical protein [Bacillus sp. FJAT-42376]AZB43512.1 hypothetical protein CEF21_15045 [Bacillus sp. FJAT-42376]
MTIAKKKSDILTQAYDELAARHELNEEMLRLRNKYGFAPPKKITVAEMKERCDDLCDRTEKAVEAFCIKAGKRPPLMMNHSRYKVSKEFPQKKYDRTAAFANVPEDRLRKAPLYTQDAIGALLGINAEYLLRASHREEVANRTRAEWKRLEYEFVERNDYNLRDLHDDILRHIDEEHFEEPTVKAYREERKKWRKCGCFSCDNYFPITKDHFKAADRYWKYKAIRSGNKNSVYCSETCRKGQENALKRLEKTGTMLPEYEYEYVMDDWKGRQYKRHNTPTDPAKLTRKTDEKTSKNGKKPPYAVL